MGGRLTQADLAALTVGHILALDWRAGAVLGRARTVALARGRHAAPQQDKGALVRRDGGGLEGGVVASAGQAHLADRELESSRGSADGQAPQRSTLRLSHGRDNRTHNQAYRWLAVVARIDM